MVNNGGTTCDMGKRETNLQCKFVISFMTVEFVLTDDSINIVALQAIWCVDLINT